MFTEGLCYKLSSELQYITVNATCLCTCEECCLHTRYCVFCHSEENSSQWAGFRNEIGSFGKLLCFSIQQDILKSIKVLSSLAAESYLRFCCHKLLYGNTFSILLLAILELPLQRAMLSTIRCRSQLTSGNASKPGQGAGYRSNRVGRGDHERWIRVGSTSQQHQLVLGSYPCPFPPFHSLFGEHLTPANYLVQKVWKLQAQSKRRKQKFLYLKEASITAPPNTRCSTCPICVVASGEVRLYSQSYLRSTILNKAKDVENLQEHTQFPSYVVGSAYQQCRTPNNIFSHATLPQYAALILVSQPARLLPLVDQMGICWLA